MGSDVDAVVAAKSRAAGEPPRSLVCSLCREWSNWRAKTATILCPNCAQALLGCLAWKGRFASRVRFDVGTLLVSGFEFASIFIFTGRLARRMRLGR